MLILPLLTQNSKCDDPFKRGTNKRDQASLPDAIVFELCQSMKGFRLVDIPLEFVCQLNWFNRANRGSGATGRITYIKKSFFLYQFLLRLSVAVIIDVQHCTVTSYMFGLLLLQRDYTVILHPLLNWESRMDPVTYTAVCTKLIDMCLAPKSIIQNGISRRHTTTNRILLASKNGGILVPIMQGRKRILLFEHQPVATRTSLGDMNYRNLSTPTLQAWRNFTSTVCSGS